MPTKLRQFYKLNLPETLLNECFEIVCRAGWHFRTKHLRRKAEDFQDCVEVSAAIAAEQKNNLIFYSEAHAAPEYPDKNLFDN